MSTMLCPVTSRKQGTIDFVTLSYSEVPDDADKAVMEFQGGGQISIIPAADKEFILFLFMYYASFLSLNSTH